MKVTDNKIIVKKGDTFTSIARELGTTVSELRKANPELCKESENPKREADCHWIYPSDEIRRVADDTPEATSVSASLARAEQFIKNSTKTERVNEMTFTAEEVQAALAEEEPRIIMGEPQITPEVAPKPKKKPPQKPREVAQKIEIPNDLFNGEKLYY